MPESILSSRILALRSSARSQIFSPNPVHHQHSRKVSLSLPTEAFPFTDAALCNLLFKTSAGAQTVVATVPAAKDAAMWTGTPSDSFRTLFERSCRFVDVYLVLD